MTSSQADTTCEGLQFHVWPENFGAEPFLLIERYQDAYRTAGLKSCVLGHRIGNATTDREGAFVSWDWDGQRLQVTNDEFGMYPLYYFARGNVCALSPSIPTLLAFGAARDFDDTALAVFFRLGFFVGEDTPFKSIRAIPPNATLVWESGHLTLTGGYRPGKHSSLNRAQAVEGYLTLFRSAIQKRISPHRDTAVPLSGGRDSRHILLELFRAGRKPKICPTVALPISMTDNEGEIASRVAALLGTTRVDVAQELRPFHAERAKNLVTNFCADEHAWFLPLEPYLKDKVHVIFDGLGANAFGDGFGLNERRVDLCEREDFHGLAQDLLGEDSTSALLRPTARIRLSRECALGRLEQELKHHHDVPNPIGSFLFWNRTRREIALSPHRILRRFHVLTPYCDHELYDCLASLPARLVSDHKLHDDAIRLALPEIEHIPYAEKAKATSAPLSYNRRFSIDTLRYALRRKRSRFLDEVGVGSRLLRCILDSPYSQSIHWIGPTTLYFLQLEEMAESQVQTVSFHPR